MNATAPQDVAPHAPNAAEPDFAVALRGAAPYVHAHHGRVFVLAFGGETALRPEFDGLIHDIALLHSLGVKLVLVHGVRPQIEQQLTTRGITPRFVGDLRLTDAATMECVKSAVGALRIDIEARLSTGLASTPMGGARLKVAGGNWVTARPVGVRDGVDHQLTGEVRRVDIASIREVLENDRIALLSPLGYSPTGEVFNLRAGDVAQTVAAQLGADKLVYLLNADPAQWPLAEQAGDANHLSLAEAQQYLDNAATSNDTTDSDGVTAEDRALLQSALAAAAAGVPRVHLVGGGMPGALLRELYTRDGCGLMIYADANYEAVHEATIEDVGGVLALIKPLEDAGVLVPRSREQLELEIGDFDVIVRDGTVIACAATLLFPENGMAEFACVAVHPDYRRSGRAAALLARAEQAVRKLGIRRLFALTTHTPHWFIEHGFVRASIDDLPMERQRLYNYQRNSIVLIKTI